MIVMVLQRWVDNGEEKAGRLLRLPDGDLLEPRDTQKSFKVGSSSSFGSLSRHSSCDIPVLGARKQRWIGNDFPLGICSLDGVIAEKSHNYNYVINVDTVI